MLRLLSSFHPCISNRGIDDSVSIYTHKKDFGNSSKAINIFRWCRSLHSLIKLFERQLFERCIRFVHRECTTEA